VGRLTRAAFAVAGTSTAAVLAGQLVYRRGSRPTGGAHAEGWKSVTILAPRDRIYSAGRYPQPVQALATWLELRLEDAPGDRGTELHARLRPGPETGRQIRKATGAKPDNALRIALRDSKQLVETGQILLVHPRPHGSRARTPGGLLVDFLERRAKGKGVL
jgi:hypothetical protein